MRRRQTNPRQWLIVQDRIDPRVLRRLRPGTGLLLLDARNDTLKLRLFALSRGLTITVEGRRTAMRVHNLRELRRALCRRVPIVLLSPLFKTLSHPDWLPLPRMRAATLARLARRQLIALGGMNEKRFAKIAALGFKGWAGISAFRI